MTNSFNVQICAFFKRSGNSYEPQYYINGILVESKIAYTKEELMKAYSLTNIEFNKLIA